MKRYTYEGGSWYAPMIPSGSDDESFTIMRPYPHIICNAERPDECEREADGFCAKCHISGFHADRQGDTDG